VSIFKISYRYRIEIEILISNHHYCSLLAVGFPHVVVFSLCLFPFCTVGGFFWESIFSLLLSVDELPQHLQPLYAHNMYVVKVYFAIN